MCGVLPRRRVDGICSQHGGAQESEYEGHCAPASLDANRSSSVTIEFWQTTSRLHACRTTVTLRDRRVL